MPYQPDNCIKGLLGVYTDTDEYSRCGGPQSFEQGSLYAVTGASPEVCSRLQCGHKDKCTIHVIWDSLQYVFTM